MSAQQQLRVNITNALERYFPDIPVYVNGGKPQVAYFHPVMISASFDRQREGRYLAVYHFGIRYEQGSVLRGEEMADELREALAVIEKENVSVRSVRHAWEAGTAEQGPLFTVDYMLYLQSDPPEAVKMGQMTGGEQLK